MLYQDLVSRSPICILSSKNHVFFYTKLWLSCWQVYGGWSFLGFMWLIWHSNIPMLNSEQSLSHWLGGHVFFLILAWGISDSFWYWVEGVWSSFLPLFWGGEAVYTSLMFNHAHANASSFYLGGLFRVDRSCCWSYFYLGAMEGCWGWAGGHASEFLDAWTAEETMRSVFRQFAIWIPRWGNSDCTICEGSSSEDLHLCTCHLASCC